MQFTNTLRLPGSSQASAPFALSNSGLDGKIAGISHLRAVKALEKAGVTSGRHAKHILMTDGARILTISRHNPVDPHTMAGIVRDAGLTEQQFRDLL